MSDETLPWKTYWPRARFREVRAFVWQPGIAMPGILVPTTFHKDFREPLFTYEGPGAIAKTARGDVWVIPGDVVLLRPDNTLDIMKPDEFFAMWEPV